MLKIIKKNRVGCDCGDDAVRNGFRSPGGSGGNRRDF